MIKVNYTSWLSTKLGKNAETLNLPDTVKTIDDLIHCLKEKNEANKALFENKHILFASRNGEVIGHDQPIGPEDEITFFAPIAGG